MITLTKEIKKALSKEEYYTEESFVEDCKTYIKAVASGRILFTVTHVSGSGMSRNINIKSFEGTIKRGYYRNYFMMLQVLGFKFKGDSVVRGGCGIDMVFDTNYTIIHQLHKMGFMTKNRCADLCQRING